MIQQIHISLKTNSVCNLGKTTSFNIIPIDNTKSFGEQLKYYRKMLNLRRIDVAKDLNIGYNTICRLEERCDDEYGFDHKSIPIINKLIDYLDVREKINYENNEYLDFILNKQADYIKLLLDKYSRNELSTILNVVPDTISRWKSTDIIISRKNYNKIKKILEN